MVLISNLSVSARPSLRALNPGQPRPIAAGGPRVPIAAGGGAERVGAWLDQEWSRLKAFFRRLFGRSAAPAAATSAVPSAPAAPAAPALPPEPGPALQTLPMQAAYATAAIDTSSPQAAIKSAAQHVRSEHPELFDGSTRAQCYQIMTEVIGILRAHGYDATRCVVHPTFPVGTPMRYGSDSLVFGGQIYDCFQAMGDAKGSRPQAAVDGPAAPGQPRE